MQLDIKELTTIEEMLTNIEVMRFSYPTFNIDKYEGFLKEMVHNYKQVAIFEMAMYCRNRVWTELNFGAENI
jgi:hypothetical protein